VAPIPASSGNFDESSTNRNTVESTVHDDEELKSKDQGAQSFGVNPIPASSGMGNPIQLAPGEQVPAQSSITSNTVDSTARSDPSSYERSDAHPPASSTLLDRVTPAQAFMGGTGPFIPESSIGMGHTADASNADIGPMMSGVSSNSTTAQLASQVPKEPRADPMVSSVAAGSTTNELAGQVRKEKRGIPEVVSASQTAAHADPEASANPEAVEEKKAVEDELTKTVPETDARGETAPTGSDKAAGSSTGTSGDGYGAKAAAGVAALGAGAAGAAVAANAFVKDKTGADPKASMPESVQDTLDSKAKESSIPQQATSSSTDGARDATTSNTIDATRETTTTVPSEVISSQNEAGFEPEAAASSEAVKEKAAVEDELLNKVPTSQAMGEPAPNASGSTTGATVPAAIFASQNKAGVDPEAAASSEAVKEKAAVEDELLSKIHTTDAAGAPAPTASAAVAGTAPAVTSDSSLPTSGSAIAAGASPVATTLPFYGGKGEPGAPDEHEPIGTTTSSTGAPQLGDPTANVAPISMDSKSAGNTGLNAPASSEAQVPAVKAKENEPPAALDSRDVSPMSQHPTNSQTQPEATTGVGSAAIPRKTGASASTPQKRQSWFGGKGTPESSKTTDTTDSKSKRRSFFGKIKDKLKQ